MNGKYTVNLVGTSEFHWSLKARNAQTMLSSQMYAGKAGAESGIESCRINSADEARYERLTANDARYYFVLKTETGELIGTSETYYSVAAREKGIVLCKESGPLATTAYVMGR
jgi:uncharacterized protein YegP (UPF0339 family)